MMTELIRQKLKEALSPDLIEIIDQSAAHAGHAGNQKGGGHYYVTIVADGFEGKSHGTTTSDDLSSLNDMMKEEIHALGINALTPSENTIGNQ